MYEKDIKIVNTDEQQANIFNYYWDVEKNICIITEEEAYYFLIDKHQQEHRSMRVCYV